MCDYQYIYEIDLSACTTHVVFHGWYSLSLTDLAITPSGDLFAVGYDRLFKVDITNDDIQFIATIDPTGFNGFNSLIALDDHWLLAVRENHELYKINAETGEVFPLGNLGYYPLGDITFFKGHYYMAAADNKLVRFDYNRYTNEISSIELVGIMNTTNLYNSHAIYGLTTIGTKTCDSDGDLKLIAFEFNDVYEVDPNTAAVSQICISIPPAIGTNGAASTDEVLNQVFEKEFSISMPNIFTPNGDQINDFFEPQEMMWEISHCSVAIFNRWGNLVFEDETEEYFRWDGTTNNDEACPEGVYYYKIELKGYCDTAEELTGFIQLIR